MHGFAVAACKVFRRLETETSGIAYTSELPAFVFSSMCMKMKKTVLVGYDLTSGNEALLADGTIRFLINQNPRRQAEVRHGNYRKCRRPWLLQLNESHNEKLNL